MISHINITKAAVVLAALMGGWHLCWSLLVAMGFAQPVMDFVFWMHFIKPVYVIEPFSMARAAVLLAVTAALGYVIGAVFAAVWNVMHKT